MLALFIKWNLPHYPWVPDCRCFCKDAGPPCCDGWRGVMSGELLLWLTFQFDGPYLFASMRIPRASVWQAFASQGSDYVLVFLSALCLA